MAAIYSRFDVPGSITGWTYYTSQPYPLYAHDDLTEEHSLLVVQVIQWDPISVSESVWTLSGTLVHVISYRTFTGVPENLSEETWTVSGTLIPVIGYITFTGVPENITETIETISGTLITVIAYIYIEQPPDNVEEEMDILSITLTPA